MDIHSKHEHSARLALGIWLTVMVVLAFVFPPLAIVMFAALVVYSLQEILFELRLIRLQGERNTFARNLERAARD